MRWATERLGGRVAFTDKKGVAIFLKHKNEAENLSTDIIVFSATEKRSSRADRF